MRELPGFCEDDPPFVPDPPAESGELTSPDSRESPAVITDEEAMGWLD